MATTTTSTFVPYHTPPPGTVSNPTNPASLSYETHITIGISIGFVTIFLLARLWARAIIKKTWIFEDCKFDVYPMLLSLLLTTLSIGLVLTAWVSFRDSQKMY